MDDTDPSSLFGMGQGCPEHGDEAMRECKMCGLEFCSVCSPGVTVCPDCETADESDEDDDPDDEEEDDEDVSEAEDGRD